MPRSVVWYVRLSYLAIALSLASVPLNWATFEKYFHRHPVFHPTVLVVVFLVEILWVRLVSREHLNWTRWVSLVVAVLALVQGLIDIRQRLQSGVAAASAFYGICLLFAVAVGLLFTPGAAPWFKKPANP